MPYPPLDTIMRALRVVLVACACLYLMDASRVVGSLAEYAVYERHYGGSEILVGSSRPDPLQTWELATVLVALALLILFFVGAYRNVRALGSTGILWRGQSRRWRKVTASWAALMAVAATSVAFGNRIGAGRITIDQAQILRPLEAAGEVLTAVTAVFTAAFVTAITLRQSRRAAEIDTRKVNVHLAPL